MSRTNSCCGNKIKIKSDLFNYDTKSNQKHATDINTSVFAKELIYLAWN